MKGVLLAAGLGSRLMPLTENKPKCLVEVGGIALIDRMISSLEAAGIRELVVVTGHAKDALGAHLSNAESHAARSAVLVENPRYHDWGNFYSLLVAEDAIAGDSFIKLDADVILDPRILPRLCAQEGPAVLAVDRRQVLGEEEMKARVDRTGRVVELNKRMDPAGALGESIGVDRIDASLAPRLFDELRALIPDGETGEYYERAYERLMTDVPFDWVDVSDCTWCEIDTEADLAHAGEVAQSLSETAAS